MIMKSSSQSHTSSWFDGIRDYEPNSELGDMFTLLASKRIISNFTTILTGLNIPVRYNTSGGSYTTGNEIVIGSQVTKPKDFDVVVGLSLHEASHIKLSNFELLNSLQNHIPHSTFAIFQNILHQVDVVDLVKNVWNYVEDRRIDRWVYQTAPGYREYYRSMYDKYFWSKEITLGLQSNEYTTETIDSYMFRLINLHSPDSDLSKLKGLQMIWDEINLSKIQRLKSSKDALDVAIKVVNIIGKCVKEDLEQDKIFDDPNVNSKPESGSGSGSNQTGSDDLTSEDIDKIIDELLNMESELNTGNIPNDSSNPSSSNNNNDVDDLPDFSNSDTTSSTSTETKDVNGNSNDSGETTSGGDVTSSSGKPTGPQLTPKQKIELEKAIKKQKEFLKGEIKKNKISKKLADMIDTLAESGTDVKVVDDYVYDGMKVPGVKTVITKKITDDLLKSEAFPLTYESRYKSKYGEITPLNEKEISEGIRIGNVLGKKLQLRGESRTTVFTRQRSGKIDKRLLNTVPSGNEGLFQTKEISSYKKANLHISIDASLSMKGSKWSNTVINTVAICKAIDMIENLDVQVSVRTTSVNKLPQVVLIYDSRKDKFSRLKYIINYLRPYGTTPEGLLFKTMLPDLVPSSTNIDSYFLNISDGEPYFVFDGGVEYYGVNAQNHTKKQVESIRNLGINVLSYFVADYRTYESDKMNFKTMYGKSAQFITITQLNEIVKTMNGLFMKK